MTQDSQPRAGTDEAALAAGPAGDPLRFDFSPWDFRQAAGQPERERQDTFLATLRGRGYSIGEECFVSSLAAVHPDTLELGDRSYIAAHAYVSGHIRLGADCTVNPFTVIRGTVRAGDGVRIGAHSSILGFNHTFADTTRPMFRQPVVSRGITIGDDVWIGSQVVILDGVTIGSHAVIGAGAVVTKDLPDWSVAVGNPARVVRSRVPAAPAGQQTADPAPTGQPTGSTFLGPHTTPAAGMGKRGDDLAGALARVAAAAREQLPGILERTWDPELGRYRNQPHQPPTVRAHCDAVELADLLLGQPPRQLSPAHHAEQLRSWQDPVTGLVAELDTTGRQLPGGPTLDGDASYHVLCVGYALDLLGSSFPHRIAALADLGSDGIADLLAAQDWDAAAWHAGHITDMVGTALLWELRRGPTPAHPTPGSAGPGTASGTGEGGAYGERANAARRQLDTVIGWLATRADARSGMWGGAVRTPGEAPMLQMVNGFYRASRGTFAQFGVPLPYPRAVIDTVLRHAGAPVFAPGRENACNVLDIIHPLWLAARQEPGYRADEVADAAREHALRIAARWVDGRGLSFAAAAGGENPAQCEPSLQGTEMWLATAWLAADLLGMAGALGYHPRGVHRPEPAQF